MANHRDFPDHGICPAAADVMSGGMLILAFPWCLLYPYPVSFFLFERVIFEAYHTGLPRLGGSHRDGRGHTPA